MEQARSLYLIGLLMAKLRNSKFCFFIALWAAKLTKLLLKIIGKRVPYYPGTVAGRICPNFKHYLNMPKTIISVTGTNGKSTTCNLLIDFFEKQGLKPINNHTFNTSAGVLACLINSVSIFNRQKYDIAVLETDELTSKRILTDIKVDYMIVTNLFRDSIEKNGSPEFMASRIKNAIQKDAKLFINADDALVSTLANDNTVFFGMKKMASDHDKPYNMIKDMVLCPKCHKILKYSNIKYAHVGYYECECGYARPKAKYEISEINFDEDYFILNDYRYDVNYNNVPNTYNILGAISILQEMGYSPETINDTFKGIKLLDSRYSVEERNDKQVVMVYCKGQNPVAVSQVFELCKDDPRKKDIVLILDDKNDSRNHIVEVEEWQYETDFEFLNADNTNRIIVGGRRSKDYVVRMLLAGIPKEKIFQTYSEEDVVNLIDYENNNLVYILNDTWVYELALDIKKQIFERWDRK